MIARLFSKAVLRILPELHVLSNGSIIELISSFKDIRLIIFCSFIKLQKFFHDEKFPDYGIYTHTHTYTRGKFFEKFFSSKNGPENIERGQG